MRGRKRDVDRAFLFFLRLALSTFSALSFLASGAPKRGAFRPFFPRSHQSSTISHARSQRRDKLALKLAPEAQQREMLFAFFCLFSLVSSGSSRVDALLSRSFSSSFRSRRKSRVEFYSPCGGPGRSCAVFFCELCCVFDRELELGRGMRDGKAPQIERGVNPKQGADEREEKKGAAFSLSNLICRLCSLARSCARSPTHHRAHGEGGLHDGGCDEKVKGGRA